MQLSIVSYLDQEATKIVNSLQHQLYDITGSRAALKSWSPHVTVGDGVEVSVDDIRCLKDQLTQIAHKTSSFNLTITGVGSLDNRPIGLGEVSTPYLIYSNVRLTRNLLQLSERVKKVTTDFDKWYCMPEPYLPHVTLAFRDLNKSGYKKGLEFLRGESIMISSRIDHIAIVEKRLNLDQEIARFMFKK